MNKIIEYSTHLKEIIDEHLYKILIGLLLGCFSLGLFLVVALTRQNDSNIVQNDTASIESTSVESSSVVESTNSTKKMYIDIKGEVNNPGVYKMKAGSRVTDLIKEAGGFKKDADQSAVNLAKQLIDQDMIIVYKVGQAPKNNLMDSSPKDEEKVNINKADSEELQKLDRVGEKMAQKIIDYRNQHNGFHSIDEIKQISGFGEKTFERLKDSLTI
ncbi:ComEA family DNA-binding protein [Apilactobacillus apinorum]|uniref:ComEA family DNA-binding protein n=1 Tax=Apilactobacillus apinorum TaxID=1218495 RepID=UPI0030E7593F